MNDNLQKLSKRLDGCKQCNLCKTRTNIVFGSGNDAARVLLIGEAPGRNEDQGGLPFIGRAGHILDTLLDLAGLERNETYIANVLKCRPPKNRNPRPEEIEQCGKYLIEQIHNLKPELIITLGNFATRYILNTTESISTLHGQVFESEQYGCLVVPMFHPAATIYDPGKVDIAKNDFVALRRYL